MTVLQQLTEGMPILFGGNRVTHVDADLAGAFGPGDRLLVVQNTGELLHVPGDTGWSGDLAGAYNRFLRWDSTGIVDTEQRFEIPLKVLDGNGKPPPRAGYPSIGNKLDATLPVAVDVTPRRVQRFRCLPGEKVSWSFGGSNGSVQAGPGGEVTVKGLKLDTSWKSLVLTRQSP